ncbi:MAG: methyltransferase domain-containing protein [Acidobacteriia bacterium]|nr:methyltransferase domain-containing protein [Terriglobia bacterium]
MDQKTILILTIQFGAGHHRVAEAVSKSCEQEFPGWDARVVDVTGCMPRWIRWVYVDLYLLVLKYVPFLWRWIEGVQRKQSHTFPPALLHSTADRLYRQIKEWNIDAIISSEVGVNEIASILKGRYLPNTPLVAVLTDYDADRAWIQNEVDIYCAGSEEVRSELLALGAPVEKVRVTGIPVDDQFFSPSPQILDQQDTVNSHAGLRILLAGGGEGLLRVSHLLRTLDGMGSQAAVTVLVGTNRKLQRSLKRINALKNIQLHIQGWTQEMPRLFHSHDLLISKPGGVTVTEAMAAGLPLLATLPLPGSEVRHCELVEKWGVGLAAPTLDAFRTQAERLVRDQALRKALHEKARRTYSDQHAHSVAEVLRECFRFPPPPSEQLQIEFDEWAAAGRGEQMEEHHSQIAQGTIDRMQLNLGERLLDLGCGTGWASRRLAMKVPQGIVVGIDISSGMIRRAMNYPGNPTQLNFLVASAEALPVRDNQVDKVFSCEALYYAPDLRRALREVYRVLKTGGVFFCVVNLFLENPYTHMWVKLLKVKAHLLGRAEYEQIFRDAGFEEAETVLVPDSTPVNEANFKPGWGLNTPEDLRRYRAIGALLIMGRRLR